jgi:UDPglucose 6-dehydrogenase/GDP-mannose 6-dehydrogenase
MLRAVLEINRHQPEEMVRLVEKHFPDLRGVEVTILGLAFKPDTDDLRESPAFPIVRLLRDAGAVMTAYDPVARPEGHPGLTGVRLATSLSDALQRAQVVILVTRWQEFERLSSELNRLELAPLVVDGRRLLDHTEFSRYEGVGWRPLAPVSAEQRS